MITRRSFLTTLALIPTVAQIPLQAAPQAAGEGIVSADGYRLRLFTGPWYASHRRYLGTLTSLEQQTPPVVYHGWD